MTKKRIGLIGFLHESNTFISEPTTYQHFLDDGLLEGEVFREKMQGTHHETAGFLSHLEEQAPEFEAVPIMFARAMPYGTITADAFQRITTRIIESWAASPPSEDEIDAVSSQILADAMESELSPSSKQQKESVYGMWADWDRY